MQEPKNIRTSVPATASHTTCPSSPPAATLPEKRQGFLLRLPPQHKPHARDSTSEQNYTHTRRHAQWRTPRKNQKKSKRACLQPPHTRAARHCFLQPLYPKKDKVSCSVFPPNTSPMQHSCNHYNAIHFARKNARFRAPASSPTQPLQSCSHHNAIWTQGFHNRIELRTHKDTRSAEHHRGTKKNIKTSVLAAASHTSCPSSPPPATLHRKHKVSCSGFLPNTRPMQHSCSHYNAICNQVFRKRIELHAHRKKRAVENTMEEPKNSTAEPSPWQSTLSHACHAKPTGRTSEPLAVHIVPRLPCKRHRQSGGDQGTPEGHPLAVHTVPATQKPLTERQRPRDARGTPGRTSDPSNGAYSRALGSAHCPTPATQKAPAERRRPRDARGTPRRTSNPLAVHFVPHLPRKTNRAYIRALGNAHCPTPAICHAKGTGRGAETKGCQRDTGAYIRPLGSAHTG